MSARRCLALLFALGASCGRFGPVYPPRPMPSVGPPVAEPTPARLVAHFAITSAALRTSLDDAAPASGEGTFPLLGSDRRYTWERGPFEVSFSQGRVVLATKVRTTVALPLKSLEFPFDLRVEAEPIVTADYAVKLQSVDVRVTSTDAKVALAERVAGVYDRISEPIATHLKSFAYDLHPLLAEAYARVARPIALPAADGAPGAMNGCAQLRLLDVEAGPTVLADGIEKDIALVVAPSITMPCADGVEDTTSLPPLSNVATVQPGPFTVTVPIAASYRELTRVMSSAFTDGRLYFSSEHPGLYLEKPELYESGGALVLKLSVRGPVHEFGIDSDLEGELYLVGHPAVLDNELRIPDLEPTIETRSFLLSLKAMTDADRIRDEARQALRLDIGERLRDVRDRLGRGLTFQGERGCFYGNVDRIEVTGVYPHAAYLRVYVAVTAHARLTMPCSADATPLPSAD